MIYKWMLLPTVPLMAATPTYFLWQGDNFGAAVIGIPTLLIGGMLGFACMKMLQSA